MAMTAFEIFGVLKLDKKDFDSGMKSAGDSASSFGSKIGSGLSSAIGIGVKAIGAATAAVVGFGKSSVSAATSFESAFTGVRKTVNATEEEYGQLSDWIMEASTKMASSKEDIAATMEIAGQLGVTGVKGLQKFTETMIMLGDTTNLNAEEAAGALARFGNIAGVNAENMDKIGSVIVDLGNHFATTEADIVNMSTRLASAGTVAGLSATDILALSTAMSSVGIQAEAGGTAMAQTIAKMESAVANGAEDMTKSWEDLAASSWEDLSGLESFARVSGMSAQQFSDAWKNKPIEAITAFINGLHSLDEADESVILTLEELGLKGVRQTNMLQSLALASDMMGNAINTANTAFEQNVALQNEANTRYGTTESQMLQAAESFKNLKVVIGQELMPTMQEFTGFTITAMQDISKGLQEGGLEGMMSSVGVALSDGLAMVIEMIPTAINAGTQLLGALGQGIIDNLPQIVDAAVQIGVKISEGLVQAIPELGKGAVTFIQSLAESFGNNAETILQTGAQLLTVLWQGVTEGLPMLVEGAVTLMGNLATYLQEAIPQILPVAMQALMEFSGTLRENAGLLVDGALNLIMTLAQGLIDSLPVLIETVPTIISNIAGIINDNAPKLIATGIELIGKLVVGIVEAIPTLIAEFPKIIKAIVDVITAFNWVSLGTHIITFIANGIKSLATAIPNLLKNFGQNGANFIRNIDWYHVGTSIINFLANGIRALTNQIPGVLRVIMNSAVNLIKSINWLELGINIVAGIASGIGNAASMIWDAVKNAVSGAWDAVTSFFQISSPSKKMMWAGRMVDEGFAKGIEQHSSMVENAMDDISMIPKTDVSQPVSDANAVSENHVIINVYGAQGQDVNEIADIISKRINDVTDRRMMAMGATT